ncbi:MULTISPECIES: type II toxin-antitoxin system VapC family toxin [unclassified Campylobacter]|uniref:type II toxin-antitoxin system VapC family toxin n=1 Tax=unclassified Campylobacter TaxID=2593542 RepID=UPI0014766252|nr:MULTISPECIES: type II toxin-antitoxin system VapC family toxin [unclassified Campylobacter]
MFLLDTNICSYLISQTEPYFKNILDNLLKQDRSKVFISSLSVAEMLYGVKNSTYKEQNLALVNEFIGHFNIVDFNYESAKIYAKVRKQAKDKNRKVGEIDMQIASIAIANNLTLVTNNEKDFNYIDFITIENWSR